MEIPYDPQDVARTCIRYMGYSAACEHCQRLSRVPHGPLSPEYRAAAEIIKKRIEARDAESSTTR